MNQSLLFVDVIFGILIELMSAAEYERMVEAYSAINQKLQNCVSEKSNLEKIIQEFKVIEIFLWIKYFSFLTVDCWAGLIYLSPRLIWGGVNVITIWLGKKLVTFRNRFVKST